MFPTAGDGIKNPLLQGVYPEIVKSAFFLLPGKQALFPVMLKVILIGCRVTAPFQE
jgi:hypothetical protein